MRGVCVRGCLWRPEEDEGWRKETLGKLSLCKGRTSLTPPKGGYGYTCSRMFYIVGLLGCEYFELVKYMVYITTTPAGKLS